MLLLLPLQVLFAVGCVFVVVFVLSLVLLLLLLLLLPRLFLLSLEWACCSPVGTNKLLSVLSTAYRVNTPPPSMPP